MKALRNESRLIGFNSIIVLLWLIAVAALPLLRFASALDAHWTVAWPALLALVFVGLASNFVTLSHRFFWIVAAVLVLLTVQQGLNIESHLEDILLLLCLFFVLSVQPTERLRNAPATRQTMLLLWCIGSLVLLALLMQNSLTRGYSHESTYAIKPLFAIEILPLKPTPFGVLPPSPSLVRIACAGWFLLSHALSSCFIKCALRS